jgi:hypothetical protein
MATRGLTQNELKTDFGPTTWAERGTTVSEYTYRHQEGSDDVYELVHLPCGTLIDDAANPVCPRCHPKLANSEPKPGFIY